MSVDLDELERLASAAGVWDQIWHVVSDLLSRRAIPERAGNYIGAFNPDTAIALITALRASQAENARLREALAHAADMLAAVAGDVEDGLSPGDLRGKYVLAMIDARDRAYSALIQGPKT